ncbi:hypothetical protein N234_31810 [Ralstonia pickettii DTP0602]|nr:hypothetical protein N234_31810 [Ralstonia pickettii DTP0602]
MAKKLTPEDARAYLADSSNFWPNDELCYTCGNEYGFGCEVEYKGIIFCSERCYNGYVRIARVAAMSTSKEGA